MAKQRACPMPGCGGAMERAPWADDLACPTCGCAGPEGVVDAIAFNHAQLTAALAEVERLKSPSVVLTEAERLLRALDKTGLPPRVDLMSNSAIVEGEHGAAHGNTLADAYAQLVGAQVAAPKGTET